MRHRLPLITTFVIWVQMVMGGIIVGKDAGFVIPDWPLSFGKLIPKLSGLVVLELVHRASALLVGVLVVATAFVAFRHRRQDRAVARLAGIGIVSLLLQVLVGGFIVIFKLPGVVTTIDVVNSMLLLAVFVCITELGYRNTQRAGRNLQAVDMAAYRLRVPAWTMLGAGLFAILVGALFRHTGASEALFGRMSYLLSHGQHTPPSMAFSQLMLALHAGSGVLAGFASLWFLWSALKVQRMVGQAVALVGLVALEAVLGMMTLETQLSFVLATLHWSFAAVLMWLMSSIVVNAQLAGAKVQPEADGLGHRTLPRTGTVR